MVRKSEILKLLGLEAPGVDSEITGVAPLDRAKNSDMCFRRHGVNTRSKAGLILSEGDFARAAWQFFPPSPPVIIIGQRCDIHETAVIGKDGFHYSIGRMIKFPHYGGVKIKDDVEIGAFTTVDRAVFDDTVIGEETKIDNHVHVGHNVRLGRRCIVTAETILGGSSIIGDDVWLGMNCTIRDHIRVGDRAFIGMGAVVVSDVPAGETWAGNPAKRLK